MKIEEPSNLSLLIFLPLWWNLLQIYQIFCIGEWFAKNRTSPHFIPGYSHSVDCA